uniref:Zinc finger RING-type eukaryotic domain-containing protein n=1 Tax=Gadus morhua TaxID=8049 RepID=A0A8C5CRZ3_GADMO
QEAQQRVLGRGMACANAPWSEENFSCSICLDVFSSPVSTPCGHNFCRTWTGRQWRSVLRHT